MTTKQLLISGFGGQGLLFAGKFLAYAGLLENREVSWLPSYGPEMRGGTANCNVILSDDPIGSPIVSKPNVLMVMNGPSLDKYENSVYIGGRAFVDSTLVTRKIVRDDIYGIYVPATKMADDMGISGLANMILIGSIIRQTKCIKEETIVEALKKVIPASKANLFDANYKAVRAGLDYEVKEDSYGNDIRHDW